MEHTTRMGIAALLLAAIVSAQTGTETPAAPAAALARAQLLEAQEGDLPAAMAAYRTILDDAQAQPAHQAAALRLGSLLWRLDQEDAGKPFLERAATLGGELGAKATAVLQGQGDAERLQQERLTRARALVARITELCAENRTTTGNPAEGALLAAVRDLVWLGEAGATALAERLAEVDGILQVASQRGATTEGAFYVDLLVELLWSLGTAPAREFLDRATTAGRVEWRRVLTRNVKAVAADLEPVVVRFLQDPDPTGEVPRNLEGLWSKLSPATLQGLAADPHPRARAAGLGGLATLWPKLPNEARVAAFPSLAPIVSDAVRGNEPRTRWAATMLVHAFANHGSAAARRLVLELLADLPDQPEADARGVGGNVVFHTMSPLADFVLGDDEFALLVAAAQRLGKSGADVPKNEARRAVELLLAAHTPAWTAASLDGLLRLIEAGYARDEGPQPSWVGPLFALGDGAQFARCLRALPHMERLQIGLLAQFLALPDARLPVDLFAVVRQVVDEGVREPVVGWPLLKTPQPSPNPQRDTSAPMPTRDLDCLLQLVGRSRSADAPAWLLSLVERAPGTAEAAVQTLVQLSVRGLGEPAWAALRTLLVWPGTADAQLDTRHRARAFAELARRGDAAAISLFPRAYALGLDEVEPLVPTDRSQKVRSAGFRAKGIGHLGLSLADQNQPGAPLHGYRDAELATAWRTLLQSDARDDVWEEVYSMKDRIPLAVVPVLAEELPGAFARATPQQRRNELWNLFSTFGRVRSEHVAADHPIRAAVASLLRTADAELASNVLAQLRREVATVFQDEALALLQRTPSPGAFVEVLHRAGLPISAAAWQLALQDPVASNRVTTLSKLPAPLPAELRPVVEQLLRDDAATVRVAACFALARIVGADAVPALLEALQDRDESVRKLAAEALERVRFQNEQQTYWRDARSGIDTSPQSAAGKLLRQAQPLQPKEQRLLALRSLGVLGTAEALPYLIDWTKDTDAEVAAAARAAIAAIHGKAAAK